MIWFTSDYHLSHENIIDYTNRPFADVELMNKTIIGNLKKCLKKNDVLYFLGDITFKETIAKDFFSTFNKFEIHFIIGNHDSNDVIKIVKKYCKSVSYIKDIIIENQAITLCHYARRVWNKSHFNAWQLHGHSHAKIFSNGKQYDVGVDNNNFFPVSFEKLKDIMEERPNNLKFITPENRNKK